MKNEAERTLLVKFLKRLPFLKSLSDYHASQIVKDFNMVKALKDEIVFNQSENSTDLYIVIEGCVRASLLNDEGQELVIANFSKGDFFGEMSLFDGRPRSATVIASEDSYLGILKRDRFLRAITNEPMIAIDLLAAMVSRLRTADEMIESLAFLDVGQRLVKLLIQTAKADGEKEKNGCYRIKKLTHKELAARTGASREAISKSLKVLAFKNIVKEDEGCFIISSDFMDVYE